MFYHPLTVKKGGRRKMTKLEDRNLEKQVTIAMELASNLLLRNSVNEEKLFSMLAIDPELESIPFEKIFEEFEVVQSEINKENDDLINELLESDNFFSREARHGKLQWVVTSRKELPFKNVLVPMNYYNNNKDKFLDCYKIIKNKRIEPAIWEKLRYDYETGCIGFRVIK